MILADWIVLAGILGFALLGMLFGFGKGLKFFTGGIFGIIIAVQSIKHTAGLCKGSTADSDSVCEGSNPSPAARRNV